MTVEFVTEFVTRLEEQAVEIARLQHAVNDWRLEAAVQRKRAAAADAEIAELREAIRRLADQDATLSVCDGNVTVTLDATFTPEERIALRDAISFYTNEWSVREDPSVNAEPIIRTLRNLLERIK
jgi:plasmid stabilization system protein ParE